MKIQQFLEHHGVASNPFAEEDAQTDPVFKEHCIDSTHHPTWDKIYGDPSEPSTAIVFGEKGAGKTAMRLQIVRHLAQYNRAHPGGRLFVVQYDDFNPFLDRFHEQRAQRRQRDDQALSQWKLWDHMDAILSLAVTQLVDRILGSNAAGEQPPDAAPIDVKLLDRHQSRDTLLLAACYDQSLAEAPAPALASVAAPAQIFDVAEPLADGDWRIVPAYGRWVDHRAAPVELAGKPLAVLVRGGRLGAGARPLVDVALAGAWHRSPIADLRHDGQSLRKVLSQFSTDDLNGQPLPNRERTDDRFELLVKLQSLLRTVGFAGIIVLVDRVDEPHLINGAPDRMKALLWPLLDNKFLKHPGLGIKLLLPVELSYFIEREERDFHQRARLDKQNMIPSLQWTGEALYDVANARLKACSIDGRSPMLRDLFHESVTDRRLIDAFRTLRVPRHLFKFFYRLFVSHANAHTDENPVWKISSESFETVLALYQRDQDAVDRGLGAA